MIAVRINSDVDKKWDALFELMQLDALQVVRGPVYLLSNAQFQKLQELGVAYEQLTEEEAQTALRESLSTAKNGQSP